MIWDYHLSLVKLTVDWGTWFLKGLDQGYNSCYERVWCRADNANLDKFLLSFGMGSRNHYQVTSDEIPSSARHHSSSKREIALLHFFDFLQESSYNLNNLFIKLISFTTLFSSGGQLCILLSWSLWLYQSSTKENEMLLKNNLNHLLWFHKAYSIFVATILSILLPNFLFFFFF